MKFFGKHFFLGVMAGAALALAALDVGGYYLQQRRLSDLMVHLNPAGIPKRTAAYARKWESLPRPWLAPPLAEPGHVNPYDRWSLRTLDGRRVALGDFRGKAVFLTFWATYCAPCIAEMPAIEALADSLKSAPVAFLMITGEDESTVRKFLAKTPIRLPIYLRKDDAPPEFALQGIPMTCILNRDGAIVSRHLGASNWDDDAARRFIRGLL